MKIIFELDTKNINDIQLATMRRTIERSKNAHFTNIELRINGNYEYEQADWLKHLIEVPNQHQQKINAQVTEMNKIHKKKDGYLLVKHDNSIRYLGVFESILYAIFKIVPRN